MTAAPVTTHTDHYSQVLDDLTAARRALATVEPLLRDAREMLRNALTCDCGHPELHLAIVTETLDTALATTLRERLARS